MKESNQQVLIGIGLIIAAELAPAGGLSVLWGICGAVVMIIATANFLIGK